MRIDRIGASVSPDDGTPGSAPGADLPGIQPGASTAWAGAEHSREHRQTAAPDADLVRTAGPGRPGRPISTTTTIRTALF